MWGCWLLRLEKKSSSNIGADVEFDTSGLLAPDAAPMAIPMSNEGKPAPFSFDPDASINPPTMPMSDKLTFLAAIDMKSYQQNT